MSLIGSADMAGIWFSNMNCSMNSCLHVVHRAEHLRPGISKSSHPHSVSTDMRSAADVFTPKAMKFYADTGVTVVNPFSGIHVQQYEIKPFNS
jgi:hypothetical protein